MNDAAACDAVPDPIQGPSPAPDAVAALPVSDDAAPPDTSPILHTDLLGDLVVPAGAACTAELQDLATRAAEYANRARSPGTRRAYRGSPDHLLETAR